MSVDCQLNVKSQSELDIGGRETCFFWCDELPTFVTLFLKTSDSIKVIPVFIHQGSVERGHVLSKRVQLICSKFIEFVIEEVDVVDKLYVGISNEELFEWEHQVIKRRDEEQIL